MCKNSTELQQRQYYVVRSTQSIDLAERASADQIHQDQTLRSDLC